MDKQLIGSRVAAAFMITFLVGGLVLVAYAYAPISSNASPPYGSLEEQRPAPDSLTRTSDVKRTGEFGIVRFAVIGDYGDHSAAEQDVADLVKSWKPDLIITTGDNNYDAGKARTIDSNIGQFYSEFIYPYHGRYISSNLSRVNRFFPALGNHDWQTRNAQPYLDYFALPGNERYYDFIWGPIHFFALDSDAHEPDGITRDSAQAAWLREKLAMSTVPWKIVYMHQPPFSSGRHGSVSALQWPFKDWGATAVLAGHDHAYERILRDGFPYFVNGLGGKSRYSSKEIVAGSQVRYRDDYGAMLVEASRYQITFKFITRSGFLVDEYTVNSTGE
jgi:tartrate-resistant acid phosphatase type 5